MRYIRLNESNKVWNIRNGSEQVDGEIQSDVGELGQIMLEDGTFINDTTPLPAPQPTELDVLKMKVRSLEQVNSEISANQQLLIELLIDMEVI